jgi:2-keto-4-pentenoate hydratase
MGVIEGEPCVYGLLFRAGLTESGGSLSHSRWNLFGLEPEVGFVIGEQIDPTDEPRTAAEVFAAVGEVAPVIEVCGRRHTLADGATPLQSLGDASCAACVVIGQRFPAGGDGGVTAAELDGWTASLSVRGVEVAAGSTTANPLGGPLASLTWCVNHLSRRGIALEPGMLVIAGAICKSRAFVPGDDVVAVFHRADGSIVGTVSTTISE